MKLCFIINKMLRKMSSTMLNMVDDIFLLCSVDRCYFVAGGGDGGGEGGVVDVV